VSLDCVESSACWRSSMETDGDDLSRYWWRQVTSWWCHIRSRR